MTTTKLHTDLIAKLQAAKRRGVPIAAINTPDQPALVKMMLAAFEAKTPILAWDFVRGIHGANEKGVEAMVDLGGEAVIADTRLNNIAPAIVLDIAMKLQPGAMLFYFNAQRFVQDAAVCQALMNLRDEFKATQRMIVLVGNAITLPGEIMHDVVHWTDPLPGDEKLLAIVNEQVTSAVSNFEDKGQTKAAEALKKGTGAEVLKRAAVALRSCSAFGAEQLTALSLRPQGIEMEDLHTQAKALIEQTPGLTFERGTETFDDIGGLDFAKEFGRRMFKGPKAPAVIVRIEELEKAMAGAKGDLSGTSGDALQVLLSNMEDNNFSGMLAAGTPGAGKSLFAKSLANTHGVKAIVFDINACKGSLVGQSERQIRQAMQTIQAIGGDRVFIVASCNAMDTIPAALQRRFRAGIWFFDLPSDKERAAIWTLNRKKFNIDADDPTPDEHDLTGADIRNICEQAYMLGCTLAEARKYIVPLKSQSPQDIEAARKMATGRFTCASRGGVYGANNQIKASGGRKVQV